MFARYARRLFSRKTIPSKCNVHNLFRISDVKNERTIGECIKVQGWICALRKVKTTIFIDISDGSTCEKLQVVIPNELKHDDIRYGSSIIAEGELVLPPNGVMELLANNISIIGRCDVATGYPYAPKKTYPPEYVRKYLHFRPRTKSFASFLRLRDLASIEIAQHLQSRKFVNVHTPILTSNDCEGAGELFSVKPSSAEVLKHMEREGLSEDETYFGSKVYLTVSAQLHLETLARALTKVYTFGPTFRAENSQCKFHLSEFYMLEAEIAFLSEVEEIANEIELLIKTIAGNVIEKGAKDFEFIQASQPVWLDKRFTIMTYDEAIDVLNNHKSELKTTIEYGHSFTKEHELFLVKHNNNIPIFIVLWPKESKAFYMKESTTNPSKVLALDLLLPNVGEVVGGGVREDDYETLKSKLPNTANFSWYLDLRKYGNVPTAGFGMGFERYLQCLLGIQNIKDTIPFPRWPRNCAL